MAAREDVGAGVPGRRGRRLQTILFVLAFLGLAAATAAGYLVALDQEREEVDERAADTADLAARAVAGIVGRTADALGSGSVLAGTEGQLSIPAFEVYAADLARSGVIESVALLAVVDGDDRAAFEAATGQAIVANDSGERVPVPTAERYVPVVALSPEGEVVSWLGLDYLSDATRGAAVEFATESEGPAVTGRTTLPGTDEPGLIVLHPIYPTGSPAGGDAVGFVAAPLPLDALVADVAASLPPGTPFRITDGGEPVTASGRPTGPHVQSMDVEIPGRQVRVTVEPARGPDHTVATTTLAAGCTLLLGLLALFVVTVRHQRRLGRTNRSLSEAEHRSHTLERLASELSRSLSGAEVAGELLQSLPPLTGAVGGAVTVVSADGDSLDLVAATGYPDDQPGRLSRVPIDRASPMANVLASGEPAWLSSPLAWRDDAMLSRYAVGNATAVVPLLSGELVMGLLVVSQPSVRRFSPDERALLMTIGALAGRALARSLRYDAEHASSVAYQRASLPPALPATPGVMVAARYRPAAISAAVGGDWYDVLRLDDGRIAVIVGDVVGHGVAAAAAMGQLRTAVRVLASVISEPDRLLQALSVHVAPIPDALAATMAYGVVDPATGRFEHVRAGHLPPIVVRASGRAELLLGQPWPPLGVSPAAPPLSQPTTLFPGDTLILYTDGVAERRGESLAVGLERLRAAAEDLGDLDPGDLCDALLEAIVPGEDQADDVAILALQLEPRPAEATDGVVDGAGSAAEPGGAGSATAIAAGEPGDGGAVARRAVDPAALP